MPKKIKNGRCVAYKDSKGLVVCLTCAKGSKNHWTGDVIDKAVLTRGERNQLRKMKKFPRDRRRIECKLCGAVKHSGGWKKPPALTAMKEAANG